ncbi:CidA/LrgA family protein [Bacillus dakarensis]|uniref:CidA/LrgA family protein n=1 Tax=Robertmurraya dakarensis TaxID=1926278 RepID=UPI00098090F6|nr:CidA/LrgA family holin-like protein [Bacillus dakarensis]
MNLVKGIFQLGILYVFFLLGNLLQEILYIPLPGSIIGLLLLLAAMFSNILPVHWIQQGAGFLLAILPLLLVPATVGIMNYPSLFSGKGLLIFLIVMTSTAATIIITAKTSHYLENAKLKREEKKMCSKHLSH